MPAADIKAVHFHPKDRETICAILRVAEPVAKIDQQVLDALLDRMEQSQLVDLKELFEACDKTGKVTVGVAQMQRNVFFTLSDELHITLTRGSRWLLTIKFAAVSQCVPYLEMFQRFAGPDYRIEFSKDTNPPSIGSLLSEFLDWVRSS